jgi:acyl carrier protein
MVRRVVADVLMVPLDQVRTNSALVADLGAESIDFLDLVFRLEDATDKKIPVERWDAFVRRRLEGQDPGTALTTQLLVDFVREEMST